MPDATTHVVLSSNSTILNQKPWTNETEIYLAGGLVSALLLLKCLLFLFASPKTRQKPGLAMSRGVDETPTENNDDDDAYSLGNLLWKTLRWRRTLPDDAPTTSLFSALRHSFETRKRGNVRAVQV
jgi:hypothetical protein